MNSTTVFSSSGKRIGSIRGETLEKTIKGSRHFLRKPETSICLEVATLQAAQDAGATRCEITDSETGIVYTAPISHILTAGVEIDFGYGRQIRLALTGWAKRRPGGVQMALFREAAS
jgi:hypothetical protein